MNKSEAALLALLQGLKQRDYRFITPSPATHARVLAHRPREEADDLRDVLGWSLPFAPETLEDDLYQPLAEAGALDSVADGRLRSRYRVSSLGDDLFLHSAYPTTAPDAVFFGPDSYRFADLIRRELRRRLPRPGDHLVDIGAGAGVGAIVAAKICPGLRVTMTDINPKALRLAAINGGAADVEASYIQCANLDGVDSGIDLALANPPYIVDEQGRDYRDGGDMHGGRASYEIAAAALPRLKTGGRLILYTGSAIAAGRDALREALHDLAAENRCALRYYEIDPDVFGEELDNSQYAGIERIAAVAAIYKRDPRNERPLS